MAPPVAALRDELERLVARDDVLDVLEAVDVDVAAGAPNRRLWHQIDLSAAENVAAMPDPDAPEGVNEITSSTLA